MCFVRRQFLCFTVLEWQLFTTTPALLSFPTNCIPDLRPGLYVPSSVSSPCAPALGHLRSPARPGRWQSLCSAPTPPGPRGRPQAGTRPGTRHSARGPRAFGPGTRAPHPLRQRPQADCCLCPGPGPALVLSVPCRCPGPGPGPGVAPALVLSVTCPGPVPALLPPLRPLRARARPRAPR